MKNVLKNRNTQFNLDEVNTNIRLSFRLLEFINLSFEDKETILCVKYFVKFQIKRFKEENEATLTTAQREVKQAIENAEANIAWMDKNYKKIHNWLLEQRKRKTLVLKK